MKEWLCVSLETESRKDDRSEALRLMQSTFNGMCTSTRGNLGCGRLYTSRIHVVNKGQLLSVDISYTIIPPTTSAQEKVHTCRDCNSEQWWAQWCQVNFVRHFTGETTNTALIMCCPILFAYGRLSLPIFMMQLYIIVSNEDVKISEVAKLQSTSVLCLRKKKKKHGCCLLS